MQFATKTIGLWLLLAIIALPFPFDWLPRIGELISTSFADITVSIGSYLNPNTVFSYSSDSIVYYAQCLLLLPITAAIVLLLNKLKSQWISSNAIHKLLSYLVAFFLLKYGIIKLFQTQFYEVEPNIAFTPLGSVSKDLLFWVSSGTSSTYNYFMGSVEVLAGFLLFTPRTRLIASMLSVGIFLNIVVLNYSYNISVKLLSALLLLSSIFLLLRYRKLLWNTFIKHTVNEYEIDPSPSLGHRIISSIVIVLLCLECLYPYLRSSIPNPYLDLKGSYMVSGVWSLNNSENNIKRIHFHSQGYLITEDANQQFSDYRYFLAGNKDVLIIPEQHIKFQLIRNKSHLTLNPYQSSTGNEVKLKKIDLTSLPILKDDFHWTVEGIIGDQ